MPIRAGTAGTWAAPKDTRSRCLPSGQIFRPSRPHRHAVLGTDGDGRGFKAGEIHLDA